MSSVELARPGPGIVQVTLSRPDALNALNWHLAGELSAALREIAADDECRVVVLTGAGRAFCAGLDLCGYGDEELVRAQGETRRMFTRQRELAGVVQQLHHLPHPVIAAVNGAAVGGGLALALGADVRIASTSARFGVAFIRAGYSGCDLGTSWLLPRLVGAARAHELMLTGRVFDAAEAERIGLVTAVTEPDELLAAAHGKAREICLNPPFSVRLTKQGMWAALDIAGFDAAVEFENRQQVVSALTDDRVEATRAFLEHRDPVYRNR